MAISFLVVDDKLLVDPSDEEEKLFTGRVKIICSADNIHSVKKSGIKLITSNLMDECLMRAKSRQKAVRQMVDEVIVKAGQKSK